MVRTAVIHAREPPTNCYKSQAAGLISDPWFESNFRANASVWDRDFIYTRTFDDNGTAATTGSTPAADANAGSRLLVLDGVKMGATVALNGHALGVVRDQFLRYVYDVTAIIRLTNNTLVVSFHRAIDTHGRYMGCTGGWDWAPMSTTSTPRFEPGAPSPTFSLGIWKSVYLVTIPAGGAAIAHVVPHVFYRGAHPTAPLAPHAHAGFAVVVAVHLLLDTGAGQGHVTVSGGWGASASGAVAPSAPAVRPTGAAVATGGYSETVVTVTLAAAAADIELWWPNGMGSQPLYNLSASYHPLPLHHKGSDTGFAATALTATEGARAAAVPPPSVHSGGRRVGFREFAYVTINDTDAAEVAAARAAGVEGSGNHTAAWRVNGALMYARGANVVPMEELEGRMTAGALAQMLSSAAAGRMNTLRVWGGGIFFPRVFYQLADELGILLYHDLMFIEQGHAPCCPFYACVSGWSCEGHNYTTTATGCACETAAAVTQRAEIQHQLRRLGSHVSIAVWDACNECGGFGIYQGFVMRTVAEEDKSRAVWPSCPSNGWVKGVQRLNSRPMPSPPDPVTGAPTAAPLVAAGGQVPHNDTRPCTACQCGLEGCSTAEHHGPYFGGSGWYSDEKGPPNVPYSGGPVWLPLVLHDPNLPAGANKTLQQCPLWQRSTDPVPQCRLARGPVGATHRGSFTSEFGAVSMPSFESLSTSLHPHHYSLHSPPMSERNHPADAAIVSYFGLAARDVLNDTGVDSLRRACYQSQLAQALRIKTQVELLRSSNSWGALVWQLNDIYPSGSWGSLEYGAANAPGQVLGGRWRPLHYLFASAIFVDVLVACGADGWCYVRNDGVAPWSGTVLAHVLEFATGRQTPIGVGIDVSLAGGAGQLQRFCLGGGTPPFDSDDTEAGCAALQSVVDATVPGCASATGLVSCALELGAGSAVVPPNLFLLAAPSNLVLPRATLRLSVGPGQGWPAAVTATSDALALFVVLTTAAAGRFADNAFTLYPGVSRTIGFTPVPGFAAATTLAELRRTLRVAHLAENQVWAASTEGGWPLRMVHD